jgi:hypothetical protein
MESELRANVDKILESPPGYTVAVPLTVALAGVLLDYSVVYVSSRGDNSLSGEPLWLVRAHVSIKGDDHGPCVNYDPWL